MPTIRKISRVGKDTIHMSAKTFAHILDYIPKTITQIAIGICSANSHPELFQICEEAHKRGICINVTTNGVGFTDDLTEKYVKNFNAIAVSVNRKNKEHAYSTINLLKSKNKDLQVNIHFMLSKQSADMAYELFNDIKTRKELECFDGAVVLLAFKSPTNNQNFCSLNNVKEYKDLIKYAQDNNINIGFDSCSHGTYIKTIQNDINKDRLSQYAEPCESGIFSLYSCANAIAFPCSFMEGVGEWKDGIDLKQGKDFIKDVWMNKRMVEWRKKLLANNRNCPHYNLIPIE